MRCCRGHGSPAGVEVLCAESDREHFEARNNPAPAHLPMANRWMKLYSLWITLKKYFGWRWKPTKGIGLKRMFLDFFVVTFSDFGLQLQKQWENRFSKPLSYIRSAATMVNPKDWPRHLHCKMDWTAVYQARREKNLPIIKPLALNILMLTTSIRIFHYHHTLSRPPYHHYPCFEHHLLQH